MDLEFKMSAIGERSSLCQGGCGLVVEQRLVIEVSSGKILDPKLLLMCWSAPCMAATAISV